MPAKIKQFQPRWVKIKNNAILGSFNLRLGDNLVLGDEMLDMSGKIGIFIGPVTPQASMQLMPTTTKGQALIDLVSRYLPLNIDFDLMIMTTSSEMDVEPLGSEKLVLGRSTRLQDRMISGWQVCVKGRNGDSPIIDRSKWSEFE
jgi:predicted component of type VI protein secretion system